MKERVDYHSIEQSMGELLCSMNVSLEKDFSHSERNKLKQHLESYMKRVGSHGSEPLSLDMKRFYLEIQGSDEASYLLQLL